MTKYVARRLILMAPMLVGITMISFTFMNLAPGDPITAMIDPESIAGMSPEQIERVRERLGLNRPIPVRYAIWLGQVAEAKRLLDVPVLCGHDVMSLVGYGMGADGVTSGSAMLLPRQQVELHRLAAAGEWDEARSLFYGALLPIMNYLFS